MVKFLLVLLPMQHQVIIKTLKSFSDLLAVAVMNVPPVDIEIILKVCLEDLQFPLILALVFFQNCFLCRRLI